MKRAVGLFIMGLALLAAPPVQARTNEEIREAVGDLLLERHPTDTAEWWRALGPATPPILISMYEASTHTYHRLRLLQGLGWFDTQLVADFLKKQAEAATDDVLRNTAIRSLGYSQGAREIDTISKYLSHSDPQTRLSAAETLKQLGDPRANSILEKFAKEEKQPWLVAKLRGELPQPGVTLKPSGTSEDRLNPEFDGRWVGFWIQPKGANEEGMRSQGAVLHLKLESATELKGELILSRKKVYETLKVQRISGRGSKISGILFRGTEQLSWDGELVQEAGSWVLEIHIRKIAGTLILRKKPV